MKNATDDRAFVSLLKLGEEAVMESVYRKFAHRVFDVAFLILKDTGWSEDIVQEVFIKLWSNRDKLDLERELWPFIYTITKRETLNKLKSIKTSKIAFDTLLILLTDKFDHGHSILENKELGNNIFEQVNNLPTQQRTVFLLSKVDGASQQEIAEQLKVSKNTVKNHMAQAIKRLRKGLLEQFILPILFFLFL